MLGTALLGRDGRRHRHVRRAAAAGRWWATCSRTRRCRICIAFLIMQNRNLDRPLARRAGHGLAGIGVVTVITRWTRTKEDAAIGIVLSTFFGAGIVLLVDHSAEHQRQPGRPR